MSKTRNFNLWDLEERIEDVEKHTYGPLARRTDIAPDFSTEEDYAEDDVVYYNGILYKFTTDHTAGAWDSSEVEETTIAENLGAAGGGAASVDKVLAGALDTRLNGLIQKYGDGAKVFCDYIEYPMYISNTESGEEYNAGATSFLINRYAKRDDQESGNTYGRATVMTVDGNVGKSQHYKVVTDQTSTAAGVNVRFTNVEIEIQKQEDDSYNCIISYDKAYLVPKTYTQIEIVTVEYDMTDSAPLNPYSSPTVTLYKVNSISATPSNARYAKMIDITPAVEYQSEYRGFYGKFQSLVTVSADLQTVTWAMNNSAFIPYPRNRKEANGWFLGVAEDLSKYPGAGDGYVLSCSSTDLQYDTANSGVNSNLDACTYVRYVTMSDGIVLVPDEV